MKNNDFFYRKKGKGMVKGKGMPFPYKSFSKWDSVDSFSNWN